MAYLIGTPSSIGIKKEATPGTAETTSLVYIPVKPGTSINHSYTYDALDTMNTGNAGVQVNVDQTASLVKMSIKCVATYVGLGYILESLFAAIPTDAGASPYTHTYVLGQLAAATFTVRSHSNDGTDRIYAGMVCVSAKFDIEPSGSGQSTFGVWTFELLGQQKTSESTGNASPTLASNLDQIVKGQHLTSMTFNAVTYSALSKFSLSVDRAVQPLYIMGQLYPTAMVPTGYSKISAQVESPLQTTDRTWQNAHDAKTSGDVVVTIQLSASYKYVFTMHNTRITEYADNHHSSLGLIKQTATLTPFASSATGNQGLSLVVTNLGANYYT